MDSSERADLSKRFADYAGKNALTHENMVAKNRRITELESHNAHLAVDNDGLRRWRASIEKSITESGDVAQGYIEGTENAMQTYWADYYKARRRIAELERVLREATDDLEAEIEARRPGELDRRIENDLDIVREARALLTQEGK